MSALWLLVLLPAVVGTALVALPRTDRVAMPVSLATAGLTLAMTVLVASTRPEVSVPFVAMPGGDLGLGVDGLAALVLPTVLSIAVLVLVAAAAEIRESRARFHGLMLLFVAAVAATVTATTLPTLLLAWEVMGATSWALIGFWWRDQSRMQAGLTAFVTTRAGDLGLYAAAGAALAGGAGLGLGDLVAAPSGWRDVIAAGVLLAAFGKAAQLPFSFWLSGAMAGPSPVSALLHSAAMVAMGGYLLLELAPLLQVTGWAAGVAAWVGAGTAVLLGVVALAQRDLKQLLAASTAAQLGFVVLGAGVGAVSGGAAHLVAHAATKALLFLAAGAWLVALGTKALPDLAGVARRWPVLGWCVTVGALSLAGLPPLSMWATKDAVLAGALAVSPWLYATGLVGAALSAAYAGLLIRVVWRRARPDLPDAAPSGAEGQPTGRVSRWQQAPLLPLAAGAALLGVLALGPLAEPVAGLVGSPVVHPATTEVLASGLLAVLVLLVVLRRGAPAPSLATGWLGLEAAAERLLVRPTLGLAAAAARLDVVLERGVDRAVSGTLGLAEVTTRADRHGPQALVQQVASATRRGGALARRLQSGQLHHYYLQALAVLGAGVLVLLIER